jgi:hypothetical protein
MRQRDEYLSLLGLDGSADDVGETDSPDESAYGQAPHRHDDLRLHQSQFSLQKGRAELLFSTCRSPVTFPFGRPTWMALGDGGHILCGAEGVLVPAGLLQPVKEALT